MAYNYITLDGESLHDDTPNSKRILDNAQGLQGIAPIRSVKRVRPGGDGGINTSKWEDAATIVIGGQVAGDTHIEMFSEWDQVKAAMRRSKDDPVLLKWQRGDVGLELQREVKLDGEVPDPVGDIGTILRYQAMFNSPDPLAYSQTLQVITGDPLTGGGGGLTFPMTFPFTFSGSSGGGATVTNGGTEPTPPIFRVHGFITAPQIVLGTDRIVMTGEVQNGQYLEIDVQEETIKLGGTVDRASQLDEDASTFFRLPVGESIPRLVGGSFDGSAALEVRFRDAY